MIIVIDFTLVKVLFLLTRQSIYYILCKSSIRVGLETYQRVFQTQTVDKLSQCSLDTVEVQALELKVY